MILINSSQQRILNGKGKEFKKSLLLKFFIKYSNFDLFRNLIKTSQLISLNLKKILKQIHYFVLIKYIYRKV